MAQLDKRYLVYAALVLVCTGLSILTGASEGVYTFLQVITVVEALCWFASRSLAGTA